MGLIWLFALAVGFVVALSPPRTTPASVRFAAVALLFGLGVSASTVEAAGDSEAGIGSAVGWSIVITGAAMLIPTVIAQLRHRYDQES